MYRWVYIAGLLLVILLAVVSIFWVSVRMVYEDESRQWQVSPVRVNMFAWRYGYIGKIKNLTIVYTREPQDRLWLNDGSDGVLVRSFSMSKIDKDVTIRVYYNPAKDEAWAWDRHWVNRDVLAAMCVQMSPGGSAESEACYERAEKVVKWGRLSHLSLVGSAHAGWTCSGTIKCGVLKRDCTCQGGGGAICTNVGGDCGAGGVGTCTCGTYYCDQNAYQSLSCASLGTSSYCNSANEDDCNLGGECPIGQGCSWTCTVTSWGSWGSCSEDCGGGTQTRTNDCGGTESRGCNTHPCCVNVAPEQPTLSGPANGTQFRVGVASNLNWNAISNWGTACSGHNNRYEVCVSSTDTGCNLVNNVSAGLNTQYSWTPTVGDNYVTWAVRANNGNLSTQSTRRNVCVEGFNINNTAYVSAWSSCDVNHRRTRTCREDCGTDDCAPVVLSEDCYGTITGRLFDASECTDCSCMNNAALAIGSRQFAILHPSNAWGPYNPTTNASGVYSQTLFAYNPGTYNFDFSAIEETYPKVKFFCEGVSALVSSHGQVVTRNFGMWHNFGGWWQTEGAGVWAKGAIKSYLPATLSPDEQVLVRQDTNNRSGVVVYGDDMELGIGNDEAKPSLVGWETQSNYRNITFGYRYFASTLSSAPSVVWDGSGGLPSYNDGGRGYVYVKVPNNLNLSGLTISGGQKYILLVDGNVNINGYINVVPGSFLMIVSSGDVVMGSNLGQELGETSSTKVVDGWYVADGVIRVSSTGDQNTDLRFVGRGSFVAWGGFDMMRDRGAKNNSEPPQKFVYRSDMLLSAPDVIKMKSKEYSEFAP
jgi:hypothetical protein